MGTITPVSCTGPVPEAKAERIIAKELQRQGWQEADLLRRPKNDAVKLEIAARQRRETTLSTSTIAARMHMGSSRRQIGACTAICAGAQSPARARGNWGYDQRNYQK